MKTLLLLILVSALKFEVLAADVIPPELVGEWGSLHAKFSHERMTKGVAVYLSSTGFAAVIGAPPSIGIAGTATFNTNTSVLTLQLSDSGTLRATNTLVYDAKGEKLTAEGTNSSEKGAFTRRQTKIPKWVYDEMAAPEAKPAVTRLSHEEVIRMASQAAERAGFRLADYREPHATYKAETKTWFVFFGGGPRKSFGIFVNDETGTTRIVPGP